MGYIVGFILAVIAAYFFIVYILPWLILLTLYGLAVYYSSRRLRVQLMQRYKLTAASGLALVGIALFTLLIAVLITQAGVHGVLSLILVIPLFLGGCVLTLEIWALTKWLPYLLEIRRCRRQIREYSQQLKAVAREHGKLSWRRQRLEGRYGPLLREQDELQQIVGQLCQRDAENLTLKRRQWREEFAKLSGEELRHAKSKAISQLQKPQMKAERPETAQIVLTAKAGLLRLEEVERQAGPQIRALQEHQQALERKAQEEGQLRQKLASAQQELARWEATYRAFRASRIVKISPHIRVI